MSSQGWNMPSVTQLSRITSMLTLSNHLHDTPSRKQRAQMSIREQPPLNQKGYSGLYSKVHASFSRLDFIWFAGKACLLFRYLLGKPTASCPLADIRGYS